MNFTFKGPTDLEASTAKIHLTHSLDSFLDINLPSDARQINTSLIAGKVIPKQSDDPRFLAAWRRLIVWTSDLNLPPVERLISIAELVRTAQVVKRLQAQLPRILELAFESEPPPPNLLQDSDDRLNLARALSLIDTSWLTNYLAKAIAEEELGEKARVELSEALVRRSTSVSVFIAQIAEALERISPTTETPGDTFGRRVTRILTASRSVLADSELEAGVDLGLALRSLVESPLKKVGMPNEEKVLIDLTRETVLFLHDIVRSRFSAASDTALFDVLKFLRRSIGGSSWPANLRKPLDLLVKDVCEMLVLLGRQGVKDQSLLDLLEVLCNSNERARGVGREVSSNHPELAEDVRSWLELGRIRTTQLSNETAVEAVAKDADGAIGLALDEARRARDSIQIIKAEVLGALEIYEPTLSAALEDAFGRSIATAVRLEHAARKRNIGLYGVVGEEIEYTPKFFDFSGSQASPRAIVRKPAVVRMRPDGSPGDVIVKGMCE